jgi:acetylornithine deacetylase/succinyl-diaminopimelate desuccinylase-like protein
LLLYGHADVVTTTNQKWTHPPFDGVLEDGYIWGRGSLDMKSGLAMFLASFLRAKVENLEPAGDVVLAVLSDEEEFGDYGARFLVEKHSNQFQGIEYAISEFGGFSSYLGKHKFYPIMVSEKQDCHLKATVYGHSGHASVPTHGGAMIKLSQLLRQLDERSLPVHVTPVAKQIILELASSLRFPSGLILRQLLKPALSDRVMKLLGHVGQTFEPLLHNTVNATIVHGGEKLNVIPSEITVELDARLLPGFGPQDLIDELRPIIGDETKLEIIRYDPGPAEPNMGLFSLLADILHEADPLGKSLPLLMTGTSDARFFSRLGIQTYGFLPMKLPADFNFIQTIHAEEERIPEEALTFGADAIYKVLQRFR